MLELRRPRAGLSDHSFISHVFRVPTPLLAGLSVNTWYVELVPPHVLEWFMQRQLLNDECLVVEWWMIWSDDSKFLTNVASIGMMYIAYSRGMGHQNMSYPLTENISAHILAYVVKSKFQYFSCYVVLFNILFKNFADFSHQVSRNCGQLLINPGVCYGSRINRGLKINR